MSNQQQAAPRRGVQISDLGAGEGPQAALEALGFGGESNGEPQQEIQEAPAQGEPSESQAEETGEGSAVQEGEQRSEHDELAEQLGVDPSELKEKTRERFSALTGELAEAKRERQLLMEALQRSQTPEQEAAPKEQAPLPTGDWFPAPEAPGEDADDLEILLYKQELRITERANQALAAQGQQLIGTIAPFLQDGIKSKANKEWESVEADIGKLGYKRSDIEPLVEELRKAEPNRTLKSLAWEAASTLPLKAPSAAQVPPTVSSPGGGREAAPSVPKDKPVSVQDLLRQAQGLSDPHEQKDILAQVLLAGMRRN